MQKRKIRKLAGINQEEILIFFVCAAINEVWKENSSDILDPKYTLHRDWSSLDYKDKET